MLKRKALLAASMMAVGVSAALAQTAAPVAPRAEDLAGVELGMTYPPLPPPLKSMGGACFSSGGDEDTCAKGYSAVTGTDGAYTAILSGTTAGHDANGKARWTLVDMIALPFPTGEQTYYLGGECTGGPEEGTPVVFFDTWIKDGIEPKPIWAATIDRKTAKITEVEDLSVFACVFEEP